MLVRILSTAFLVSALAVGSASAQAPQGGGKGTTTTTTSGPVVTSDEVVLEGDTTPRPALPTIFGDTGLWFVSTAETLPSGKWSASVVRANYDRRQGLTDVNQIGVTAAFGIGDRFELFGSWRLVRLDRDVVPTFIPSEPTFGGVSQEYPYVRRGWSKTLGGPTYIGGKWSLIQQGRGDAMSLATRAMIKFPTGATWSGTNDLDGHVDLIASREFGRSTELTGQVGGIFRGDPDEFRLSDGVTWGLGATFPTRSPFRALIELTGEWVIKDNTEVLGPVLVAEDGSVAGTLSPISDPASFKFGGVYQAKNGLFFHAGGNYSFGTEGRTIAGNEIDHSAWGLDLRLGWHPGVTPPRQRVRRIRETTTVTNTTTITTVAPAPPAAAPNRPPTANLQCTPGVLEPGQTAKCTTQATDPEGGPLTYACKATAGNLSPNDAPNMTFTAPQAEGPVTVTCVVTDNAKNPVTTSAALLVRPRTVIEFEDVHFDFDRFNLRPDALKILDDAIAKLQANPNIQVTIEGHCDSIGTQQYNLALGERRANSARDYLVMRGIAASRLRTVSYGEDRPIDTNETAAGRARNRRAHLAIIMQ